MCTEEVQTDHTVVKTPILIFKTLGYGKMFFVVKMLSSVC